MTDPISGSVGGGTLLRPCTAAGSAAGGKVHKTINEDNVTQSNERGTELAEQIHENNQRHLREGMISPDTAYQRAEDTKKFEKSIVDTQDQENLSLSAMRQNKKNDKGLKNIEKEQIKADAAKRQELNATKADDIMAEAPMIKPLEREERTRQVREMKFSKSRSPPCPSLRFPVSSEYVAGAALGP